MSRAVLAAALLLVVAVPGDSASSDGWATVKPGLEYREVAFGHVPGDSIYELRCDPARTRLGLITAREHGAKSRPVSELAKLSHCWAAVNGGYFGPDLAALGFQRDWRRVLCPDVATGSVFGGVFVVGPGGPDLLARQDFVPGPYTFALQCGPRLITKRDKVPGIHADPPRRRTGLGYDRHGRIFLYATGPTTCFTFAECQAWLTGPTAQGGLDPVGVLNLDGGSSTQLSLHAGGRNLDVPGLAPVPVAVGVFPRS